jgi:TetR/AcrR family transcriptional regulator
VVRRTRGETANRPASARRSAPDAGQSDELSPPNRDRILAAALEEFAAKGFDGATTAGVARRAGVTQPLVHYHFENKDELWKAALTDVLEQMERSFGGVMDDLRDLSSVDRLKVLVRRFVYFSAAHPEFGRILAYEGATGGPRLDWLLQQHATAQVHSFGQLLEAGAEAGWIKPLPMDHVATCLGAAAAYLFIVKGTMRELYGVDVEDPEVIERHADTVVELFFNGLLAEPVREAARPAAVREGVA